MSVQQYQVVGKTNPQHCYEWVGMQCINQNVGAQQNVLLLYLGDFVLKETLEDINTAFKVAKSEIPWKNVWTVFM